jgi:NADH-quinone oxidoreductase subunit J
VVVLFVFVIMLLGPDAGQSSPSALLPPRATVSRVIGGGALGLLSVGALVLMLKGLGAGTRFARVSPEHGSIEAVGGQLFTRAIVPFELATALLVVAVVGAIAVARSLPKKKSEKSLRGESERLFGGPIHPRDAGHPISKEPQP